MVSRPCGRLLINHLTSGLIFLDSNVQSMTNTREEHVQGGQGVMEKTRVTRHPNVFRKMDGQFKIQSKPILCGTTMSM